jgi:hypothetical protein
MIKRSLFVINNNDEDNKFKDDSYFAPLNFDLFDQNQTLTKDIIDPKRQK